MPAQLFCLLQARERLRRIRPTPRRETPSARSRSSHDCNLPGNPVVNCGFETGDFTGWVTQDMAIPFFRLGVFAGGVSPGFGLFASSPTDGAFAAINGFDGDGPGTIVYAQDMTLPPSPMLEFDYRCGWDMTIGAAATQDRVFTVEVEPSGGGAAMQTDVILVAKAGSTTLDTGPLSAMVDLSAFGGQSVRLSFEWSVPEFYTGPAFFQLDNVQIMAGVPTMPAVAVATLAAVLLLLVSLCLLRRRRGPA